MANVTCNLAVGFMLSRGVGRPTLLIGACLVMGLASFGISLPVLPSSATFLPRFPSVSVSVRVEPLGGPLESLKQKRCALSVMVGEDFRHPRIKFDALTSIAQVAVVAATHPLAKGKTDRTMEARELADHLKIVLSDPSPCQKAAILE